MGDELSGVVVEAPEGGFSEHVRPQHPHRAVRAAVGDGFRGPPGVGSVVVEGVGAGSGIVVPDRRGTVEVVPENMGI